MSVGGAVPETVRHKSGILCWAARLVTMIPALVLAIWNTGAYTTADSHHVEPSLYLFDAILFAIGLLVGVIAFWWHGLGGLCLLLVGLVYVMHSLIRQQDLADTSWWLALLLELPFVVALVAGGMLHLLAWRREERLRLQPKVSV